MKNFVDVEPVVENQKLVQFKGMWIRPEQGDEKMVKEAGQWKRVTIFDYSRSVLLDLGGHIGSFPRWALENLNPKLIVSVEPEPSNIFVFKKNFVDNKRVVLHECAVVSSNEKRVKFYPGVTYAANSGLYPTRYRREIEVDAFNFRSLLNALKPTLIKCDIEAGEYLLNWKNLPKYVKEVCMEFHRHNAKSLLQQNEIDEALLQSGFKHIRPPKQNPSFGCSAIYSRRV